MKEYLNILSDIHCEKDELGFNKYIDTISNMILDKDFKTPFCIGIFGRWGSGKTSFMHLLEKRLLKNETEPLAIPVWFNPWRFQKEEHLIIPFLKTIESKIKRYSEEHNGPVEGIADFIKKAVEKIGFAAAAVAYGIKPEFKLGCFGFDLDVAKSVEREEELIKRRIEEAKTLSDQLSSIYYEIVDALKDTVDEEKFRIVVFIDDLDRCLPDKAVELLESIKLFLDIKGYLMIMGVDRDVVKKGISYRYRFFEYKEEKEDEGLLISPEHYLDKMIQLPLELPALEPGRKSRFISSLLGGVEGFVGKTEIAIIEAGVGENPRTLKRFINLLAFTVRLAETVKKNILEDRVKPKESEENKDLLRKYFIPLMYIKWTIIVFRFPKVHSMIKGNKKMLIDLQGSAKGEGKGEVAEDDKAKEKGIHLDERLRKVLSAGEPFPDNGWLIDRFILLTESTVIREKEIGVSPGFSQTFNPGDMVLIPKGSFLYGAEKIEKEIEHDYYIDVFPVTNRQYKEFLDDRKGHRVPYKKDEWAKPYNWDKKKRVYPEGMGDHPVVIVSYDDVVKYCRWRSEKDGGKFRLPTEEEWEKAARGTDGRDYPWGNEFDKERCNTEEAGIEKTTPVNNYPDGISPYKCYDMAGNVWEWTESWDDENKSQRVLRGGSWNYASLSARCANRFRLNPGGRNVIVGFRCVRTLE